jgi:hypothetical protein
MYNKELIDFCIDMFKKAVDKDLTSGLEFKIVRLHKKEIIDLMKVTYNGWKLERVTSCDRNSIVLCPTKSK